MVFTDESRFHVSRADGRQRVYRRRGERFADCCVVERDAFGGGSVMVWRGITGRHRTELIIIPGNLNAIRYREEILIPTVLPFLELHGPGIIFQQDNARPHTANVIRDFFDDEEIKLLPWPARSPDLSPIEQVWDEMERRIRALPQQPQNPQQLAEAFVNAWNNIPQDFHQHLITSMRRRCSAVIEARVGHTRY